MPIVFAFCIWSCTANPDAGNDHVINGSIAHVSQYNCLPDISAVGRPISPVCLLFVPERYPR